MYAVFKNNVRDVPANWVLFAPRDEFRDGRRRGCAWDRFKLQTISGHVLLPLDVFRAESCTRRAQRQKFVESDSSRTQWSGHSVVIHRGRKATGYDSRPTIRRFDCEALV